MRLGGEARRLPRLPAEPRPDRLADRQQEHHAAAPTPSTPAGSARPRSTASASDPASSSTGGTRASPPPRASVSESRLSVSRRSGATANRGPVGGSSPSRPIRYTPATACPGRSRSASARRSPPWALPSFTRLLSGRSRSKPARRLRRVPDERLAGHPVDPRVALPVRCDRVSCTNDRYDPAFAGQFDQRRVQRRADEHHLAVAEQLRDASHGFWSVSRISTRPPAAGSFMPRPPSHDVHVGGDGAERLVAEPGQERCRLGRVRGRLERLVRPAPRRRLVQVERQQPRPAGAEDRVVPLRAPRCRRPPITSPPPSLTNVGEPLDELLATARRRRAGRRPTPGRCTGSRRRDAPSSPGPASSGGHDVTRTKYSSSWFAETGSRALRTKWLAGLLRVADVAGGRPRSAPGRGRGPGSAGRAGCRRGGRRPGPGRSGAAARPRRAWPSA